MITASHNPAEYNGMKVSTENARAVGYDAGLKTIKQWIEEGRPTPVAQKKGQVFQQPVHEDYLNFLLKYKGDYSGIKIAMEAADGFGTYLAAGVTCMIVVQAFLNMAVGMIF